LRSKEGANMSKKKNRKQVRQEKFGCGESSNQKSHFQLRHVAPLTPNQEITFRAYHSNQNIVCHGYAGTGKTYISLYLALNEVLSGKSVYEKIVIIRSVVPSRDMGFLPGSMAEKARVYEEPYKEICDDLFGRGDGYDVLKLKGLIQFTTTSFLRGVTFKNAIVIIDEAQNLNFGELYTTLTRMGDTSRLILCGDFRQTDLRKHEANNSLVHMMNVLKKMSNVCFVEFCENDIVRSDFVKEFIIKSTEYQDDLGYNIT
jgi:phosphate starvation-inducible protein PhoH